ncbi:hypothetical protein Ancab_036349 [Ancistrocladus abbreviatus]
MDHSRTFPRHAQWGLNGTLSWSISVDVICLPDGTQVQLRSTSTWDYLCAENSGGTNVVANRSSPSGWETFKLWRVDQDHFNFRVFNGQFWTVDGNSVVMATANQPPGDSETFQLERNGNRIRLKSIITGKYVQVKNPTLVTADYTGDDDWGDNPSVFILNAFGQLRGEFQNHWNTFIVEDDFQFMSQNGLNAVTIPVGWWIASDPKPPAPFVGGSLKALDNAFNWAESEIWKRHVIKVIVDLHAAPGSQNDNEHSGTRDGSLEWGTLAANIQQTVDVIDFLANRYAHRSGLLAIELINGPLAPAVTHKMLHDYYKVGYHTVRKYSSDAYVVMSCRLGPADPREFYFMIQHDGFTKVGMDVHYYNLFSDSFNGMSAQQNIDYIYNQRAGDLGYLTQKPTDPLVFVGEWTDEWEVNGASKQDYQNFAKAQLDVYGRATFGWSYWTFKCNDFHWDLQRMIQQGYISLN